MKNTFHKVIWAVVVILTMVSYALNKINTLGAMLFVIYGWVMYSILKE